MPSQQLLISESEVRIAVEQYLETKGIFIAEHGILHPRITYTKMGAKKHYHFSGYYINDGEYSKNKT